MPTTLDRPRPVARPDRPAPSIREVCLVGDPRRRYVHIPPEAADGRDRRAGGRET